MRIQRFHDRSLMMAVAAIAVALSFCLRSARIRERAKQHHQREAIHRILAERGGCGTIDGLDELLTIELTPGGASVRPRSAEAEKMLTLRAARAAVEKRRNERLADYHARCASELARAAWRPWVWVSPAPPPDVEPEQFAEP